MIDVILQAAALIVCGVLWRVTTPLGLEAEPVRRSLTGVVYVLLLPGLVLLVLWQAPLGLDSVRIAVSAAVAVGFGLLASWLWFRRSARPNRVVGALLLASAFPNATYLGLPVLESAFGPWARSIAIQYDLLACTPLLLSAGIALAAWHGGGGQREHPLLALLKVPPLWAAVAGIFLNLAQVPLPAIVHSWLTMLGSGVVPLMLFSLGLGLRWAGTWRHQIPLVLPVALIQLMLMPLLIWGLAATIGLQGQTLAAVVLEAAMPSMVLGIVLCDRYNLDTGLYAMAVTVTTALSMITLPLWFAWVI
jgi:predicted permease